MSKARELSQRAGVDGALSNRNVILNGSMIVAQRGTSVSGITSTGYYTSDRWRLEGNTDAAFTMENVSDAPEGFGRSTKVTVTTADASIGATQYSTISQRIEAQNLLQLKYGTSSAQEVTVSFWVKSSTTDAFAVSIEHGETSTYISQTLTINAANTWEYKTFTFVGNTSTAINTDNGTGLYLYFMLAAGSTYNTGASSSWSSIGALGGGVDNSWIGTTNATFQITGVQLEVGDTATPFEHRSYGQELALCQRYFQKIGGTENNLLMGHSHTYASGYSYGVFKYDAPMRAIPSGSVSTNAAGAWRYRYGSGLNIDNIETQFGIDQFGISQCRFYMGHGRAAETQGWVRGQSSASYVMLDAEL